MLLQLFPQPRQSSVTQHTGMSTHFHTIEDNDPLTFLIDHTLYMAVSITMSPAKNGKKGIAVVMIAQCRVVGNFQWLHDCF